MSIFAPKSLPYVQKIHWPREKSGRPVCNRRPTHGSNPEIVFAKTKEEVTCETCKKRMVQRRVDPEVASRLSTPEMLR